MDPIYIIRRPLLTEKSTFAMNERGQYTFEVDRTARKDEIKRAVETLYGVKVVGITTQVRKGLTRRTRYGYATGGDTKKATVRLKEGQTIDLL